MIPRLTQWDMVNEAKPGGRYEARLIGFTPSLIEKFHQSFGQFSATPALQGSARSVADGAFATTFAHALAALADNEASHQAIEGRALAMMSPNSLARSKGMVGTTTKPALSAAKKQAAIMGLLPPRSNKR